MTCQEDFIFRIDNLTKSWMAGGTRFDLVVEDFTLAPGEIVVLKGVSGSGKSTLLDILALTLRPDAWIRFDYLDQDRNLSLIGDLWEMGRLDQLTKLRRRDLGYILQTGGLLPFLDVRQNISFPLWVNDGAFDEGTEGLIQELGLSQLLDKRPSQLSTGERQRVAIARALVHRPRVVLADEPTASLDPDNAARVFDLLIRAVKEHGAAAVIATHDWDLIAELGLSCARHDFVARGGVVRSTFGTGY